MKDIPFKVRVNPVSPALKRVDWDRRRAGVACDFVYTTWEVHYLSMYA